MSRQRVYYCATTAVLFLLLTVGGSVLTARQEATKLAPQPPPGTVVEKQEPVPSHVPPAGMDAERAAVDAKFREAEATINKIFAEYDLKPHHLPAIPDNPPPHEGAMIIYPLIIEPPDLLLVEVLEALPGRPISGERLVRYDGMVSLGFYGEVHVAGLTLRQAKVKILQHLRRHLSDEMLGLYEIRVDEEEEKPGNPNPPKPFDHVPKIPKDREPLERDQDKKPHAEVSKPRTVPSLYKTRSIRQGKEVRSYYGRSRLGASIWQLGRLQEQEAKKAEEPRQGLKIPLSAGGQVTITIEVQSGEKKERLPAEMEAGPRGPSVLWPPGPVIDPQDSDRIFLDVTAHNSKPYYVQGDVAQPGHLPFTGHDTVLDALDNAGGLLPTAEPKDIHLVRPGRAGKPGRVYKVDLEAIREKGDVTSNYQMFPGDRLVVGRNDVVKKTIQVDRLAAGMQTIINSISQESSLLRSLKTTSPESHVAILKDLVDFWIQEMNRPGGVELNEQTLREALLRRLQDKPEKK
jgi:protein involved in polysaccharide export with SLBB domain